LRWDVRPVRLRSRGAPEVVNSRLPRAPRSPRFRSPLESPPQDLSQPRKRAHALLGRLHRGLDRFEVSEGLQRPCRPNARGARGRSVAARGALLCTVEEPRVSRDRGAGRAVVRLSEIHVVACGSRRVLGTGLAAVRGRCALRLRALGRLTLRPSPCVLALRVHSDLHGLISGGSVSTRGAGKAARRRRLSSPPSPSLRPPMRSCARPSDCGSAGRGFESHPPSPLVGSQIVGVRSSLHGGRAPISSPGEDRGRVRARHPPPPRRANRHPRAPARDPRMGSLEHRRAPRPRARCAPAKPSRCSTPACSGPFGSRACGQRRRRRPRNHPNGASGMRKIAAISTAAKTAASTSPNPIGRAATGRGRRCGSRSRTSRRPRTS
jgi:hypothetical protein